MSSKAPASLSLDLDNKWSYLKTHGSEAWKSYPSYLPLAVPRILDFLDERDAKITFFVVGQDAELEKNHEALAMLSARGHEIASHSFHHEPWLHLYTPEQLHEELERAEASIKAATGATVSGFRGPGFSISEGVLEVLHERNYRYDATAFPNILNPLARAYFFAKSNLSEEEKEQRKGLFGRYTDAFRPVKPFRWTLGEDRLLELPVTTMPLLKIPMHFSYLLYLASYAEWAAKLYFKFALSMCRLTGTQPSLLLHPLDFLGGDDEPDLAFFPGMNLTTDDKLRLMGSFFDALEKHFEPVTIGEHVARIETEARLRELKPSFDV